MTELASMTLLGGCLRNAKKIAIRVDATSQIGTGHFMRCLTLADELKQHGAEIRFISRDLPQHLGEMLKLKGFEFISLLQSNNVEQLDNLAHSKWLGTSQAEDAQASIDALSDKNWDWLIVDHYALDTRWETKLRESAKKIMVIDDIADRQHNCDLLLDQNYYADMEARYIGKVPTHCQLLLGPRYALLRDEFKKWREQVKPRTGSVKSILIFFGGVDSDNYTGQTLDALNEINLENIHIDVVIGAQHPYRSAIETIYIKQSYTCHVQTDNMAELMATADLAIGAGGTATWERCCLGLPTLVFCIADNQKAQINDAATKGLLYAQNHDTKVSSVIKTHLTALINNSCLRHHISNNALQEIDPNGKSRLISEMGCSGLTIRKAKEDDSFNLFTWRNHTTIRSVSKNKNIILWEDHQRWLHNTINSEDKILLIAKNYNETIGVIRFDKQDNQAEVSIYLVPEKNNKGQGKDLLITAEQWLKTHYPEIKYINAIVLDNNISSHKLFLKSRYQLNISHYQKSVN